MCTPCRQTFNDIDAIRILTNVVLAFVHIQNHNIVLVVDFEEVFACWPADIYLFKVNNGNTRAICQMFKVNDGNSRTMCEIC